MNLNTNDLMILGVTKLDAFKYVDYLNKYLKEFEINTPNRFIAFLANLLHESGNFKYAKEIASGIAYEGRLDLGNTQKGDGVRFAGKSLAQITGRANYTAFTLWCKKRFSGFSIDFVKNPELLEQPEWAVLGGFWFWVVNKLEILADNDDFRNVASIWNTGRKNSKKINGMEDRLSKKNKLEKWLTTQIIS